MTEDGQEKKALVYLNGQNIAENEVKAEDMEAFRQAMKTVGESLSQTFKNLKGNLKKSYDDLQEDTLQSFSPNQLDWLKNHLPKIHTEEEGRFKVTMNDQVILDISRPEEKKED